MFKHQMCNLLLDFCHSFCRLSNNTMKEIKLAVALYRQWQGQRNERVMNCPTLNIGPINVRLEDMTKDELNYTISRFLCEVKKQSGEKFPGTTLHELLIWRKRQGHNIEFSFQSLKSVIHPQVSFGRDVRKLHICAT